MTLVNEVGNTFTEGAVRRWMAATPMFGNARRARIVASLYVNARIVPPCSPTTLARALGIDLPPVRKTDAALGELVAFAAIARSALPTHLKDSGADVLRLAFALAAPDPILEHRAEDGVEPAVPVPAWVMDALTRGRPGPRSGIRPCPAGLRFMRK